MGFFFGEFVQHGLPDERFYLGFRFAELDFVEESAFEGRIEVRREVCGGNQYAVQVLQFLKDDVLQRVVHPLYAAVGLVAASADDGISFIEEEDGLDSRLFADLSVTVEEGLDVLLAFADPLGSDR